MHLTVLYKNRVPAILFFSGLLLISLGIFHFRDSVSDLTSTKVEVLSASDVAGVEDIYVELSGAVMVPGVYKLKSNSRIFDLFEAAGGVSSEADKVWIEKNVNQAQIVTDGQKLYIPKHSEGLTASKSAVDQSTSQVSKGRGSGMVNINTDSSKILEELPGIGPAYAQKIIEHRPYSSVEEMLIKGAVKEDLFNKIKNLVVAF